MRGRSERKPWEKPEGGTTVSKPWAKRGSRPQENKFNPSTSLGMVKGNGEHSRTKGRRRSTKIVVDKAV
jgi:hypothetical protein